MKNETVIKAKHVSKKYCRSLKHTMQYGIQDIVRNAAGLTSHSDRLRDGEFWALDDISFEVKMGASLNIIGANGSGKSTLLKLINGIFFPDRGRIEIRGRVGALIEVGAGFHPMLTGRENVYVNGAVLGMGKKEIDRKFDEIVDFAGVADFIDTPVKHYSSGMYVRLGFAVAVHCDPDILLIDEVLAVGDIRFQIKCMDKLRKLKENGTSILLVTHTNPNFGDHGILLENGREKMKGTMLDVWNFYERSMTEGVKATVFAAGQDIKTGMGINAFSDASSGTVEFHVANRPPVGDEAALKLDYGGIHYKESSDFLDRVKDIRSGSGEVRIVNTELLDMELNKVVIAQHGQDLRYRIHMRVDADLPFLVAGFTVRNNQGLNITGGVSWTEGVPVVDLHVGDRVVLEFVFKTCFVNGTYSITAAVSYRTMTMPGETALFDFIHNCDVFEVAPFKRACDYAALYYLPMTVTAKVERTSGVKTTVSDYEEYAKWYTDRLKDVAGFEGSF